MNAVACTGIPGCIIGNTTENLFENIACSVLAIKPDGYVSPNLQVMPAGTAANAMDYLNSSAEFFVH